MVIRHVRYRNLFFLSCRCFYFIIVHVVFPGIINTFTVTDFEMMNLNNLLLLPEKRMCYNRLFNFEGDFKKC